MDLGVGGGGLSGLSVLPLCWDDGVVLRDGGSGEVAVPCSHHEIGVVDCGRGGEVHGVIAAQRVALCNFSSRSRECVVEADHVQFATQPVDRPDRGPQRARVDAATAMCGGRGGTGFGVNQLAGSDGLCVVPQLGGNV